MLDNTVPNRPYWFVQNKETEQLFRGWTFDGSAEFTTKARYGLRFSREADAKEVADVLPMACDVVLLKN